MVDLTCSLFLAVTVPPGGETVPVMSALISVNPGKLMITRRSDDRAAVNKSALG
jgi:hypothetical protein